MPIPSRHSGTRSINYDNLILCGLVTVTSFLAFTFLLSPDGLVEFHDTATLLKTAEENDRAPFPYVYSNTTNALRLTLPTSVLSHSILVGNTYGITDAVRKLLMFFTSPILETESITISTQAARDPVSARDGERLLRTTVTLSDVYRAVFMSKRFRKNSHRPEEGHGTGVFDYLSILHLCTAASCVGPSLSLAFAHQTKAVAANPMTVKALLLGDPPLVHVVGEELMLNGVHLHKSWDYYGCSWSAFYTSQGDYRRLPSGTTVRWCSASRSSRVYGDLPVNVSAKDLYATCAGTVMCDHKAQKQRTTLAHLTEEFSAVSARDTGVAALLSPQWSRLKGELPPTEATSSLVYDSFDPWLPRRTATDTVEVKSLYELDALDASYSSLLLDRTFDLVSALDVDANDALGVAAFLRGLTLRLFPMDGDRERYWREMRQPANIVIPIHNTEWAGTIGRQLESLSQKVASYRVIALTCSSPYRSVCGESAELSGAQLRALRLELERTAESARLMGSGLRRAHGSGGAPPLILLFTQMTDSLRDIKSAAARFAATHKETRGANGTKAQNDIYSACDRYLSRQSPSDDPAQVDRRAARHDFDSFPRSTGYEDAAFAKHIFHLARDLVKALLFALPIVMCLFLICNISRSWRRRG